ncbi:MAG: nickel pincer cofactor biosynthesis protein LarC [Pirellulales bacterium]|nr:nickel pincer cofactor biosynthesis protein LarC [Pirellulales bacterium]
MFAYLDCASGISGDMTLGALVDAGADLAAIQAGIHSLGLTQVQLSVSEVKKKGFRALQLQITHPPEHAHRHLHHITDMIGASAEISPRAKALAGQIFTRIGEAEAKVHGTTIRKVHFHEVGAIDSIADIVGTAIAWDQLDITAAAASPIPTGHGFITIAHGRCSLPAPATAEILTGVPLAESTVQAELTTPTGAAIVRELCGGFGPSPAMTITKIGYGAGQRDLAEQANLLRILLGERTAPADSAAPGWPALETLCLLETNLDDVPGEVVGHAATELLAAGALDVYGTPIQMKKSRPGVMLSVLCRPGDADRLEQRMFEETGTLGIRRTTMARRALVRQEFTVETLWGPVAGKLTRLPGRPAGFSPEYEDCRKIALAAAVPLREVQAAALAAYARRQDARQQGADNGANG